MTWKNQIKKQSEERPRRKLGGHRGPRRKLGASKLGQKKNPTLGEVRVRLEFNMDDDWDIWNVTVRDGTKTWVDVAVAMFQNYQGKEFTLEHLDMVKRHPKANEYIKGTLILT